MGPSQGEKLVACSMAKAEAVVVSIEAKSVEADHPYSAISETHRKLWNNGQSDANTNTS